MLAANSTRGSIRSTGNGRDLPRRFGRRPDGDRVREETSCWSIFTKEFNNIKNPLADRYRETAQISGKFAQSNTNGPPLETSSDFVSNAQAPPVEQRHLAKPTGEWFNAGKEPLQYQCL
jgi:hypothetical protein